MIEHQPDDPRGPCYRRRNPERALGIYGLDASDQEDEFAVPWTAADRLRLAVFGVTWCAFVLGILYAAWGYLQ